MNKISYNMCHFKLLKHSGHNAMANPFLQWYKIAIEERQISKVTLD